MGENKAGRGPEGVLYRPLVPVAVAFAIGIMAREWVTVPLAVGWGAIAAAAVAVPAAWAAGCRRVALGGLYALIAGAGWARLSLAAREPPAHDLSRFVGAQAAVVKVRGVVVSDPLVYVSPPVPLCEENSWLSQELRKARLELAVEEVVAGEEWRSTCGRVRVILAEPFPDLRYGDQVVVAGPASAPRAPSNPGQFDMARYLRRKGIRVVLAGGAGAAQIERRGRGSWPMAVACAARVRLRRLLTETFARSDRATSAMLCATVLGDRTELGDDLEEAFQRSGTMHLLAISGLHVGIVAFLIWKVCSLLGLGRGKSGAVVLAAVLLYALMTGATPSVVRATIMTAALVVGILGRRRLDPLQVTAMAALVLLAARPYDLFSAGFQLSFAAVVSIACLYDELQWSLLRDERLIDRLMAEEDRTVWQRTVLSARRGLARSLSVSLAAWLAVFPLIAYYFHLFSPVTVLTNLVAVPLLGLVVTLGFVHLGVAALSPLLASATSVLAVGATTSLATVVELAAGLPFAWTYCSTPALGWLAGYYAFGAAVLARRRLGLGGRQAAALWMSGVLVYLFATLHPPRLAANSAVTAARDTHLN